MKAFIIAMLMATPALAQQERICATYDELMYVLQSKHGEEVRVQALTGRGNLLQILVNSDTGAWTALETLPTGQSCIADTGGNFQMFGASG